MAKPPCLNPHV